MTAKSDHRYPRSTSVACPSCRFPNKITDTGTYLHDCLNDTNSYGHGSRIKGEETISSYEWQRKHHPDKEPTACKAQFFVDAHLQIVARVSTVQWEGEG